MALTNGHLLKKVRDYDTDFAMAQIAIFPANMKRLRNPVVIRAAEN
ncbi:MAG TPA: hypothetical protein VNE63_02230 [Candidatus Acidoferrales bacterium]|nr:hypothetical protein [Candidatus Acidoferrales bacterium]